MKLKLSIALYLGLIIGIGAALGAPTNPPTDPYPADNDPYPPTSAILFYDYSQGGLVSVPAEFVIPIGWGVVTVKIVPKNLEKYAVGYYSSFEPGMVIDSPLMTAIEQKNGGGSYIWPNWIGDVTPKGYTPGEESSYWHGRRYYFEDLPWPGGDKDIDDLWVDIAWRSTGANTVEIKAVVNLNKAGYPNPFEMTFEREAGSFPVHFTYQVHEPSTGPDSQGQFVLRGDPITILLFESGDVGDWGLFFGSVPNLPVVAFPAAIGLVVFLSRRRRDTH